MEIAQPQGKVIGLPPARALASSAARCSSHPLCLRLRQPLS